MRLKMTVVGDNFVMVYQVGMFTCFIFRFCIEINTGNNLTLDLTAL